MRLAQGWHYMYVQSILNFRQVHLNNPLFKKQNKIQQKQQQKQQRKTTTTTTDKQKQKITEENTNNVVPLPLLQFFIFFVWSILVTILKRQ